jgi:hypothetical protein
MLLSVVTVVMLPLVDGDRLLPFRVVELTVLQG